MIPNQTWAHRFEKYEDTYKLKRELAAFARALGHIPIAYVTIPWGRTVFGPEVILFCFNPEGKQ